jgi:hypothetical protein
MLQLALLVALSGSPAIQLELQPGEVAQAIKQEVGNWSAVGAENWYLRITVADATRCTDGTVWIDAYRKGDSGPGKRLPIVYFRDDTPIDEMVCEAVYNIKIAIISREACGVELCKEATLQLMPCLRHW